MATLQPDKPLCVYCYKPTTVTELCDLDKDEIVASIHKRFLKLLSTTLNFNYSGVCMLQCTNCCDDCYGILKTFCDLYHQIKCLELKLNWQLDQLLNVMKWADRVPSRIKSFKITDNFENKVKFRKCLKRKFKRRLSHTFPRVSLPVLKSGVIPKIENLETEICNDQITLDNLEVISIAAKNSSGNVCAYDANKPKYFLLGWIATLSALILLCHLEVSKSSKIQNKPDNVSLEVNDKKMSEIRPFSTIIQASSPDASDTENNWDEDCDFENGDNTQDSNTNNMEIRVIKKETTNSYFKTKTFLSSVANAPKLKSLLLQTESSTEVKNVNSQPTESQHSVLPLLPETCISSHSKPKNLPNVNPKMNSLLLNLLNDSPQIQTTSSYLHENAEVSIIPTTRSLRTKYQCSKCKATFSNVSRLESHQRECLLTNETEYDPLSENDINDDTVDFVPTHDTKCSTELPSSSKDSSDKQFTQDIKTSQRNPRKRRQRTRSKLAENKFKKLIRKLPVANIYGNKYLCSQCTPNISFHTAHGLKMHEYYKHTNGRAEIDKTKLSSKNLNSIRMEGLSITTKYTCSKSKCGETFLLPQELENHLTLHGNFTCSLCDFTANYAIELIDHELEHSDKKKKLINPDKVSELFECVRCQYKSQSKRGFVNHFLTEHLALPAIQAKCPICHEVFPNKPRVSLRHYINYHDLNRLDDPNSKAICTEPDCSAYFLTEEKLHLHRNRQHISGCTSKESNELVLRRIAKRKKIKERVTCLNKPLRCELCDKRYMYQGDLKAHIIQSHGNQKLGSCIISKDGLTVDDMVLEENAKYFCKKDNCQEKFREEQDFERHSKLHGEFPCNFCEVVKPFALDLAIHEIVHETTVNDQEDYLGQGSVRLRTYKCSRCPYQTGMKVRYLDHFVSRHLNLTVDRKKCPVCKFEFILDNLKKEVGLGSLKKAMHQHFIKWHDFTGIEGGEEKNAEKCDKCSAVFKTKIQLLYHLELVHNPEKPGNGNNWGNECIDCGKQFTGKSCLRQHRKLTHKVECKFGCEVEGCLKKFETVRQLMHHDVLTHSSKELFICSDCGKSFFSNSWLSAHRQVHEKKVKIVKKHHVCDKCGKSFKDRPKLKQHYRFHEGRDTWEFECEICKKKLSSKQKLNEHMRTHTKEKPFVCQVCGVAYAHRHNLRIHTNSKHKEVEDVGSKRVSENFASWRKGKKLK